MILSIRKYWLQAVNVIAFALLWVLGASAFAQANTEVAICKERQDKATRTQAELCSAHPGCNMVLTLHKDCAKMEGFFSRLKGHLSGRKEITNNDVFEANTPMLTPSEALKSKVSVVQKIIRDNRGAPNQGIYTGKNAAGADIYYEGGIKDGEMHGVGVYINSEGTMSRGQVRNGRFEGQAQAVTSTGAVLVGDFVGSKLQGNVALQNVSGTVLAGYQGSDNKWSGVVDFVQRNGDHSKVLYSSEGVLLAEGAVVKVGQKASIPSAPKQIPQQHVDVKAVPGLELKCAKQRAELASKSLNEDVAQPDKSLENGIRYNQRVIELFEGPCASTTDAKQVIAEAKATIATNQGYQAENARGEQLKEELRAKEAAEVGEAVGLLLGMAGQIQQIKGAQKQALYDEQQRQLQAQQEQQRRTQEQQRRATPTGNTISSGPKDRSRSRLVHNPAADARSCVQLIQDSTRQGAGISGNWRFVNNCNSTVEIFWCFVQDNGSCREGGTWTVSANKGWPTFGNKPIRWGACRGKDGGGMDNDSNGDKYTCHLLTW